LPIAFAAILFAIFLFVPAVLNDGDTWSHIAIGRWILEHHAVPWADPFSLTALGKPWIADEWFSELLMAIAYQLDGVTGVLILVAIAAGLAAGLLLRHLRVWLDPLPAVVILVFALSCGSASMLARPHMLALPALEIWTAGLLIARSRGAAPSWWLLPVMTAWANLHGSFAFGLVLAVPLALEALIAGRPARGWAIFLAAAIVAAMVSPYGWHILEPPIRVLSLNDLGNIGEWRSLDFSKPQPLEVALLALLYLCLSRGVRIPLIRLLIVMGLLHMALQHARHGLLAGVVGALVLAEPFSGVVNQPVRGARRGEGWWQAAGACLAVISIALRLVFPAALRDGVSAPVSALAHVPPELRSLPVFNEYAFGGLLIFEGIRPFVDARAELYGDAFLDDYAAITNANAAALDAAFRRYGIAWTILPPEAPMVAILDQMPGWRRDYSDKFAVVHARLDR
jgi:hypothetical protein